MTRRILGLALLFLATGLLVPGTVQGQKKAPANDIESDKLAPGTFKGKLKGAISPGADFELEIEYKHLEINQKALQGGNRGGNQNIQQLLQAQQQLARAKQQMQQARNPQQAAQAMQQMQRTMQQMQQNQLRQFQQQTRGGANANNAFKVVTETKDIDFHASGDLVIRRAQPAMEFDEKGNLRTLTPENLKILKGDPKLPGFEGKLEDLKPGAIVQVVMKRAAADPKAAPDPTAHKNVVTMIVIERDGQDAPMKGKKK